MLPLISMRVTDIICDNGNGFLMVCFLTGGFMMACPSFLGWSFIPPSLRQQPNKLAALDRGAWGLEGVALLPV